jgi:hypothetical protein
LSVLLAHRPLRDPWSVGRARRSLEDLEAGEVVPCLGVQVANPEGLGACLAERSFQEEEGVPCSYLEVQVVHPCLAVEEAFPYLVVEVAFPCLAAGVACPFLEEEEVVIHLTSLHQGEEEVDYSHPSQEGVEVEEASPSLVGEEYSPSAADIASRITASVPRSLPALQHS